MATSQVVIATTTDLTPWRGGGFGMFSTNDNHGQRFLRITATTSGGEVVLVDARTLLEPDSPVRDEFVRARARPTTGNLDALATAIAGADLLVEDGIAAPPDSDDAAAGLEGPLLGDVQHLDLAVHRVWFEREVDTLVPELVIEHRVAP